MLAQRLASTKSAPDFRQPNRKPLRTPYRVIDGISGGAWPCAEIAMVDKAGLNRTGTPTAGVSLGGGQFGPALSFNGSTGSVTIANAPGNQDLALATPGFTISFWMNPTSVTTGTLFDKSDGNTVSAGWWIDLNDNHATGSAIAGITFAVEFSSNNYYCHIPAPTTSVWTHVVLTYNGTTVTDNSAITGYYNGVAQTVTHDSVGAVGTKGTDSAQPLVVGNATAAGSGNGFYSGLLDNIIVDRKVWTATQAAYAFANPFFHFQPIQTWLGGSVVTFIAARARAANILQSGGFALP
jgi:Concanavalin A-like lectin/glucanases superfamily